MNAILENIGLVGIVPVIAIEHAEDAEPLAQALVEGGLPCAEVTFRTKAGREAISRIAKSHPTLLLGAGTVLTVEQVQAAVDAGAKFIVSPGLNRKVVEYCLANDIPMTPGVLTPSEIEVALEYGLEVVKFFPAEAGGGLAYLKAISAPYKSLRFIPTGGVDESNLLAYLKFPKVHACGGSWMVKPEMITNHQFDEIKKITSAAVAGMLGFSLKHVGINGSSPEESLALGVKLGDMLHMKVEERPGAMFVGGQFEITKRKYLGEHGHLAIGTNFINRAIAHLARCGVNILPETRAEKDGKLVTVYLDLEIGGFAVHLLQV
ncbi:MAG: 2-dehydro-3-deoxyphosphogluconate aldolase/4-hydroxy-2-oxoglutarate aldolase [Bacteroidetes bacterium]|jgi:2-dehydro-3-deoxyphosphogluconate aldolase/(4S)-4-hydroxy-2-oxoglutarate aldolase|nr:2-dehydro-3-deoxyphosphogluconate aldolase/4-hydroxy-2-oxoglutarate aldolase [Bacteroidota bacterium]